MMTQTELRQSVRRRVTAGMRPEDAVRVTLGSGRYAGRVTAEDQLALWSWTNSRWRTLVRRIDSI